MSKDDPLERDLRAGDGIYEVYGLCLGSLPRPRYEGGSGQREKIEAWFTEGYGRPQAWALHVIQDHRYPTEGFEEALRRDPAEQSLIVEAIKWIQDRLHGDAFLLELATMAESASVEIRECFREHMVWVLNKYLSDTTAEPGQGSDP